MRLDLIDEITAIGAIHFHKTAMATALEGFQQSQQFKQVSQQSQQFKQFSQHSQQSQQFKQFSQQSQQFKQFSQQSQQSPRQFYHLSTPPSDNLHRITQFSKVYHYAELL